ncbi:hypothetical protein HUG10_17650 [Halorarum halophilum]|uniref:Uncharacterized protein n=1 Tax=Halorarum halophilum TaxID=2743090 RepID=A0A7D5L2Z6_9EURY|nr:hypothetical protein [Halobaculum halophilum]QLG29243.1 hypothetical protein HUG10_17650 [Halobaculum halophilum]
MAMFPARPPFPAEHEMVLGILLLLIAVLYRGFLFGEEVSPRVRQGLAVMLLVAVVLLLFSLIVRFYR